MLISIIVQKAWTESNLKHTSSNCLSLSFETAPLPLDPGQIEHEIQNFSNLSPPNPNKFEKYPKGFSLLIRRSVFHVIFGQVEFSELRAGETVRRKPNFASSIVLPCWERFPPAPRLSLNQGEDPWRPSSNSKSVLQIHGKAAKAAAPWLESVRNPYVCRVNTSYSGEDEPQTPPEVPVSFIVELYKGAGNHHSSFI